MVLNGGGGYMESKNKNSNTTTYNSGDLLTSNQNSTGKARTIPTMPQQDLSMTLQIILRLTQVVL